eukprot:758473-Hanusia_phi.AAC.5
MLFIFVLLFCFRIQRIQKTLLFQLLDILNNTDVLQREMSESEIEKAREAALKALDKPLEKMRAKELLVLLKERGVECKECRGAEKSFLVQKVIRTKHGAMC